MEYIHGAILGAVIAIMMFLGVPNNPPIVSNQSGCSTDTECGCIDDCLDTAPRVSDTLILKGE